MAEKNDDDEEEPETSELPVEKSPAVVHKADSSEDEAMQVDTNPPKESSSEESD